MLGEQISPKWPVIYEFHDLYILLQPDKDIVLLWLQGQAPDAPTYVCLALSRKSDLKSAIICGSKGSFPLCSGLGKCLVWLGYHPEQAGLSCHPYEFVKNHVKVSIHKMKFERWGSNEYRNFLRFLFFIFWWIVLLRVCARHKTEVLQLCRDNVPTDSPDTRGDWDTGRICVVDSKLPHFQLQLSFVSDCTSTLFDRMHRPTTMTKFFKTSVKTSYIHLDPRLSDFILCIPT